LRLRAGDLQLHAYSTQALLMRDDDVESGHAGLVDAGRSNAKR
jgi:hypothetical protein